MKNSENSGNLKQQYLISTFSSSYGKGAKKEKSEILDFVTRHFNLNRDYASKILRSFARGSQPSWKLSLRGAKPKYCNLCIKHLQKLHIFLDRMGPEKMKAAMPIWLPFYAKEYGLSDDLFKKLSEISASTIGRLLQPYKIAERKRNQTRTRRPAYFNYKQQIPIKNFGTEVKVPGYLEGDTVAHHGHSLLGPHHWSLTVTDIATTWTENEAMPDRKAQTTLDAIGAVQTRLPFEIISFHSDCGMEFMNDLVKNSLADPENYIIQTRGREYKSNDQAHVEQKNFTHVRNTFGYYRFDTHEQLVLMQDVYRNEHRLLMNFFTPQRKMVEKYKIASKYKRVYDKLQTPYQRVIESEHVSEVERAKLKKQFESLNPLSLRDSLNKKLERLKNFKTKDEEKIAA